MVFRILFLFYYLYYRKLQFRSRSNFLEWQEAKLGNFLKFVQKNSPFYSKIQLDGSGCASGLLHGFPVVEKTIMMENFDKLNTKGLKKEQCFDIALMAESTRDFSPMISGVTVGLSSGTSGHRGIFCAGVKERARYAGALLAKCLPKEGLSKPQSIALFMRANSNLYSSVNSRWIKFSFFDMAEPLKDHLPRLQGFSPKILFGPPAVLVELADAQRRGTLLIYPVQIFSVAECLEADQKDMIERIFGVPVSILYQCTEGFLASTCRMGTLHLNEDLVHIEKKPVELGSKRFYPIITDFTRTTQPIVRYLLNDVLVEKTENCACGSVFQAIETIEGRSDDVFLFRGEKEEFVSVYPDFVRKMFLEIGTGISEYKASQTSLDQLKIEIQLVKPEDAIQVRREVHSRISAMASNYRFRKPEIQLETSITPIHDSFKKRRRIQRNFVL